MCWTTTIVERKSAGICDKTNCNAFGPPVEIPMAMTRRGGHAAPRQDRKSTRLNSSHDQISYAVFCLKKKKMTKLHGYRNLTLALERDTQVSSGELIQSVHT